MLSETPLCILIRSLTSVCILMLSETPVCIMMLFESPLYILMLSVTPIWLILTRSNPPLKSAGYFPKIVSNCITRVKPINVEFLSHFFLFFQLQASSRDYQIEYFT